MGGTNGRHGVYRNTKIRHEIVWRDEWAETATWNTDQPPNTALWETQHCIAPLKDHQHNFQSDFTQR